MVWEVVVFAVVWLLLLLLLLVVVVAVVGCRMFHFHYSKSLIGGSNF